MKPTLFIFLLAAQTALGATYYVDNVGGSDVATGTSTNAPWKHCPGDTSASGNALMTLSAGDTVVFRGGVTYVVATNATINATSSGSLGASITYLSGHLASPQWGSSPAVINGTNASTAPGVDGVMDWGGSSYLTANGLAFVGGGPVELTDTFGAIGGSWNSGGNILIENCSISNNWGDGIYLAGSWDTSNPGNFVVSNCTMGNFSAHGVLFRYGMSNALVVNCTIHNAGLAASGGDPVGVFNYSGGGGINYNTRILNNDLANAPRKSPIILSGVVVNALVASNYMHGAFGYSGLDVNMTLSGGMTNLLIYNNIWDIEVVNWQGAMAFTTEQGYYANGIGIFNNTIICSNPPNGAVIGFLGTPTNSPFRNVSISNNILAATAVNRSVIEVDQGQDYLPTADPATFRCDHNVYLWNANAKPLVWGHTNYTFTNWRVMTGQDANSLTNQPSFVSSTDYHLASGDTIARGNGANLSSLFTTDKDGNARPSGGAWDIGAYQFLAPAPSSGLTIQSATVGTLIIR